MKKRVPPSFRRGYPSLLALATGLLALPAAAQNELSNFTATGRGGVINAFATDYQSLGVNPANLGGANGNKIAFTLFEFGVGLQSRTAPRSVYRDFMFNTDRRFKDFDEDGGAERRAIAQAFTGENAINMAADVTLFGFSYYSPEFGGLAVNTRYRMVGTADLNKNAAELIFLGDSASVFRPLYNDHGKNSVTLPKASDALAGTRIQMQAVQEFNIGYGRKVMEGDNVEIMAGVGFKYLRGIGILDLSAKDGTLTAYGAMSPVFDINYATSLTQNSAFNLKKDGGSAKFPSVGSGTALDFGLSATIQKKIRVALSVVDLGTMSWKANLVEIKDQELQTFGTNTDGTFYEGPTNYNLWKALKPFNLGDDKTTSPLTYTQAKTKRDVKLPAKLRAGVAWDVSDKFAAGIDYLQPFDKEVAGAYKSGLIGVGLDYKPAWWVKLSTGANGGGGYGFGLPLGISFASHHYEAGIATRNIMGLFSDSNPYTSLALGFLRFRIGESGSRN